MLYSVEMFAQFAYSVDLSYQELMDAERVLQESADGLLKDLGGDFIHFEALGDTLRVQCVFVDFEESLFHAVCDALVPFTQDTVEARLLFVDKGLDVLGMYFLSKGKWRESLMNIPVAGPIGKDLRKEALKQ